MLYIPPWPNQFNPQAESFVQKKIRNYHLNGPTFFAGKLFECMPEDWFMESPQELVSKTIFE